MRNITYILVSLFMLTTVSTVAQDQTTAGETNSKSLYGQMHASGPRPSRPTARPVTRTRPVTAQQPRRQRRHTQRPVQRASQGSVEQARIAQARKQRAQRNRMREQRQRSNSIRYSKY